MPACCLWLPPARLPVGLSLGLPAEWPGAWHLPGAGGPGAAFVLGGHRLREHGACPESQSHTSGQKSIQRWVPDLGLGLQVVWPSPPGQELWLPSASSPHWGALSPALQVTWHTSARGGAACPPSPAPVLGARKVPESCQQGPDGPSRTSTRPLGPGDPPCLLPQSRPPWGWWL